MRRCSLALLGLVLEGAACSAPRARDDVAARADAIRPRPGELGWRAIPWRRDLVEGQEAARRERRPIFLFVSAYDPLGRC
jgi:hypothetical protein